MMSIDGRTRSEQGPWRHLGKITRPPLLSRAINGSVSRKRARAFTLGPAKPLGVTVRTRSEPPSVWAHLLTSGAR